MKNWLRFPISLVLIGGWALGVAWGQTPPPADVSGAIQAIQQAPDPSAVVAAYANGAATDRNNPRLHEAYVARMVDLGLPELAYHQAQTLTSLESNNGLAWGVVAYIDARRGQMPEAISAINLAGQFAPDNQFIQRTAGEIIAWYDVKADKATIPQSTKDGLAKVRGLIEKRSAYVTAYNTAKDAYQSQAKSASEQPAQTAPTTNPAPTQQPRGQPQSDQVAPLGYGYQPAPPPAYYYPDYYYPYYYPGPYAYYYDWGPAWVEPAPWWWWQPFGFFIGFTFCPFSHCCVFDDCSFFCHRFCFRRDGFFHHGRDGHTFAHNNPVAWHHDAAGKTSFFGTPAKPNPAVAQFSHDSFHNAAAMAASNKGLRGWTRAGSSSLAGMTAHSSGGLSTRSTMGGSMGRSWTSSDRGIQKGTLGSSHGSWTGASQSLGRSTMNSRGDLAMASPSQRSWGSRNPPSSAGPGPWSAPRSSWGGQSYSYHAPMYGPSTGSGFRGGSFGVPHSGGSFHGGGFNGFGGGSHGGGWGGGGFHGGGGGGFHGGGGGHGGGHSR